MGIISKAEKLLGQHRFVPAQDQEPDMPTGWTLLDLFMAASGAHRCATPVAYWQGRELRAALTESWSLLDQEVEGDPRVWSNQKGRSAGEIRDALIATVGDVNPPNYLWLRPGSKPTVRPSTCKMPFVPTVAAVQAWMHLGESVTVTSFLSHYGIEAGTSSLDLLDLLDPTISVSGIPMGLVDAATSVRDRMADAEPEIQVTAQYLHLLANIEPTATVASASTTKIRLDGFLQGTA